jgi:sulfotransferase
MKKTFHFLAGLPRSGSTLLGAILNQNQNVFVTPTSPMLDLLIANQEAWHNNRAVIANPEPDQLTNITRAMIDACWEHRPEPVIIDKNRGWNRNMPASSVLFQQDIKVVATVRDLPSIMASWLTLIKENPDNSIDKTLASNGKFPTDKNRCDEMWDNMVNDCVSGMIQLTREASERLLIVKYDNLISAPYDVLGKIYRFLDLPNQRTPHNLFQITTTMQDNDMAAYGFKGLHTVRPKLAKTCARAEEVLGPELFDRYSGLQEHIDAQ